MSVLELNDLVKQLKKNLV
ncbi:hypothetical protein [Staphylococcus debuckii]